MEQLIDAVIAVAVMLIPVLGTVAVKAFQQYLASKDAEIQANIGVNNYYLAENLARSVVGAAEQTLELDSAEKKKDFACGLLKELAEQYNVPVSGAQIDGLVEAAVLALRRQQEADFRAR